MAELNALPADDWQQTVLPHSAIMRMPMPHTEGGGRGEGEEKHLYPDSLPYPQSAADNSSSSYVVAEESMLGQSQQPKSPAPNSAIVPIGSPAQIKVNYSVIQTLANLTPPPPSQYPAGAMMEPMENNQLPPRPHLHHSNLEHSPPPPPPMSDQEDQMSNLSNPQRSDSILSFSDSQASDQASIAEERAKSQKAKAKIMSKYHRR